MAAEDRNPNVAVQDDVPEASETAPLLSRTRSVTSTKATEPEPIDPPLGTLEAGDAPIGALPLPHDHSHGHSANGYGYADSNGYGAIKDNDTYIDRQDVESQVSGEVEGERKAQFEGLPDVKSQLNLFGICNRKEPKEEGKELMQETQFQIFLSAADQTIIIASYGQIGSELEALNNTSWVATSYFLTLTSFQPLYGKLSDIFGRKPCLLFGYAVFGTGTFFCGRANNMTELVIARAFAGIGGGGMTTVVSVLMSDIVPLRERGTWQGVINIIFATGAGVGAPLGGILADKIGWRWAFYGQIPLCILAFLSVAFALQLPKRETSHLMSKFKRIDFPGAIVLVLAVFTLLLGLDTGGNSTWSSPTVIISLCLSMAFFTLFVVVEQKYAKEPFAPGRIIFNRSMIACYMCNFFSFAGWMGVIYFMPLFWQAVCGYSATTAGVRLLPGIVAGVTGSLLGGLIMQKTGKYYYLTIGAYALLTIGIIPILLFTGIVTIWFPAICAGLIICGFGNGIGVTTSLVGLIANADPQDQAVATACSYLFRSLGSVVGLSISATVVQQVLRTKLEERFGKGAEEERIVAGVRKSLEFIKTLDPEVREIVRGCYRHGIHVGFWLMFGTVACSAISACESPLLLDVFFWLFATSYIIHYASTSCLLPFLPALFEVLY
ncbi:hypothetical protein MMC25_007442 [Agyrium rufum]|nr:hypothetical protein [Agyrium rufum]